MGARRGRGLQKNPEYMIKSELKDKTLNRPKEFVQGCSLGALLSHSWHFFPPTLHVPKGERRGGFSLSNDLKSVLIMPLC